MDERYNTSLEAWTKKLEQLPADHKAFFAKFMQVTLEFSSRADQLMEWAGIQEDKWTLEVTRQPAQPQGDARYEVHFNTRLNNPFELHAQVTLDRFYRPQGYLDYFLVHKRSQAGHTDAPLIVKLPLKDMLSTIGVRRLDLEDRLVNHARFFASRSVARGFSTFAKAYWADGLAPSDSELLDQAATGSDDWLTPNQLKTLYLK